MTPHGPVRLAGAARDEGVSGTVASVATILLVSPLGFLIHGTSAMVPAGTVVNGQLDADLKFRWFPQDQVAQQSSQYQVATASSASALPN